MLGRELASDGVSWVRDNVAVLVSQTVRFELLTQLLKFGLLQFRAGLLAYKLSFQRALVFRNRRQLLRKLSLLARDLQILKSTTLAAYKHIYQVASPTGPELSLLNRLGDFLSHLHKLLFGVVVLSLAFLVSECDHLCELVFAEMVSDLVKKVSGQHSDLRERPSGDGSEGPCPFRERREVVGEALLLQQIDEVDGLKALVLLDGHVLKVLLFDDLDKN